MSYVPSAAVALTGTDRILQGATYQRDFTIKASGVAVNLSAFAGTVPSCQFRETASSSTVVLTPTMSWPGGGTDGVIRMVIPAATTTALGTSFVQAGVFHIEIVNGSTIERVVEGTWQIDAEVTR